MELMKDRAVHSNMEGLLCFFLALLQIGVSAAQSVEMSGSGDSNVSLLVPFSESITTGIELTTSFSSLSSSSVIITAQVSVSLTSTPAVVPSTTQPTIVSPNTSQPSSSATMNSSSLLISSSTPGVIVTSLLPSSTIQVSSSLRSSTQIPQMLTKATPTLSSTPSAMSTSAMPTSAMPTSGSSSIALVAGASGGAAVAVVVLIVLFIIIICCCVCVRRHKKYTLETGWEGGFVKTDTFPLQVPSYNTNIPIENTGFLDSTTGAASTFGIQFPETPKPRDGEDLPPLVILNPVQKFSSNTLPSKSKLKANISIVSIDSNTGLKPSRSSGDIRETATPSTFQIQPLKPTDSDKPQTKDLSTEQTQPAKEPSPEQTLAKEESEKHNQNGTDANPRESSGYVYMQPPPHIKPVDSRVESIYQVPSSIPAVQDNSSGLQATADTLYDVPPSLTNHYARPQVSPIIAPKSADVPSHYDTPKSALAAFREKATTGKSGVEDRQTNSTSVYDVPRTLVLANTSAVMTQETVYDTPEQNEAKMLLSKMVPVNDSEDTRKRKTSLQMQSSASEDEHEYCMPPDETLQLLKELAEKKQIKEKGSNSPAVKPRVRPKPKMSSKQKDSTTPPPVRAAATDAHPNSNGSHDKSKKNNSDLAHEYDTPPSRDSDTPNEEQVPTNKPPTKPKAKPRAFKQPVGMPKDLMQELYSKQNANGSKTATVETQQSGKRPTEKPAVKEKPKTPLLKPRNVEND